jgi:hypothetical protein
MWARDVPAGFRRDTDAPVLSCATSTMPMETTVSTPSLPAARHAWRHLRSTAALALALGLCSVSTGCIVRVYQPMSGLHRPVVVDPRLPNFQDVKLDIHCVPDGLLNGQEASALCQKVGLLFENQGALVRTHISEGRFEDEDYEGGPDSEEGAEVPADAEPPTALTLELRAREVHSSNDPLSWAFCLASLTIVPAITEATFVQDVVIRDGSGFLLVSDSLEGRLVRRFGAGPWVGNAIADLWRAEEDKLSGERASRDLSDDLYLQLSQLAFNAKMHAEVLQSGLVGRAGGGP